MKTIKKKSWITPGVIILALLAAAAIYALLLYTEKKTLETEDKAMVYVATGRVSLGTEIEDTNVENLFELKEVYVSAIPEDAILSVEEIKGLTTIYDISKGTILTKGMFRENDLGKKGKKEPVLLGFKADEIYQVIGGTLRPGDLVHIYIMDEFGDVELRWNSVCIEDTFDSNGNEIGPSEEGKATLFNIYMEKTDVEEFYRCLDSGLIRIVKV